MLNSFLSLLRDGIQYFIGNTDAPNQPNGQQPHFGMQPQALTEEQQIQLAINASLGGAQNDEDLETQLALEMSEREYDFAQAQQKTEIALDLPAFFNALAFPQESIEFLMDRYADYDKDTPVNSDSIKRIKFKALIEAFNNLNRINNNAGNLIKNYFHKNLAALYLQPELAHSPLTNQFNSLLELQGQPEFVLSELVKRLESEPQEQAMLQPIPDNEVIEADDDDLKAALALSLKSFDVEAEQKKIAKEEEKAQDNAKPSVEVVPKVNSHPVKYNREIIGRQRLLSIDVNRLFATVSVQDGMAAMHLIQQFAKWDETASIEQQKSSLQVQEMLMAAYQKASIPTHTVENLKQFIANYVPEKVIVLAPSFESKGTENDASSEEKSHNIETRDPAATSLKKSKSKHF